MRILGSEGLVSGHISTLEEAVADRVFSHCRKKYQTELLSCQISTDPRLSVGTM